MLKSVCELENKAACMPSIQPPGYPGNTIKKTRRNHSASFKAKVALSAIQGDSTMTEMSQQYGVHANQILAWKKHLLSEVGQLFQRGASLSDDHARQIKQLQAKVGELTMENDFLSASFGGQQR